VLIVYRPDIIPDARAMVEIWREAAARRGWPGLYLVATNAFRFDAPERLGFDALVEFPPHGFVADSISGVLRWLNRDHRGAAYDYGAVAAAEVRRNKDVRTRGIVFPGVMPGWDNEARRPGAGTIYHGAEPGAYGAWLRAAIARARRTLPENQRFVFINAWNEWAEGAYLEPDRAFGRAFLLETARALAGD
jgi:lipopolysaccharide biosynthesis protein